MPEKPFTKNEINHKNLFSIAAITLASLFTANHIAKQINAQIHSTANPSITTPDIANPSTANPEFPLTLSATFLNRIQEVITNIETQHKPELAPHLIPYLQQIHDSYAHSISDLPTIYAKRITDHPDFSTHIAHHRTYFDRQNNTLNIRLHHNIALTHISQAIQVLRHKDLATHNPFQIPEHLQQAFLYATAFEFNNLMLNDYLAAIYTAGQYIPKTQKHISPQIFKESLATHLAHHYPQPNTLRKQTHHETELATEYFQGYLQEQSTLTEIPNTKLYVTEEFIKLTSQKPKHITTTEIEPVLLKSY